MESLSNSPSVREHVGGEPLKFTPKKSVSYERLIVGTKARLPNPTYRRLRRGWPAGRIREKRAEARLFYYCFCGFEHFLFWFF